MRQGVLGSDHLDREAFPNHSRDSREVEILWVINPEDWLSKNLFECLVSAFNFINLSLEERVAIVLRNDEVVEPSLELELSLLCLQQDSLVLLYQSSQLFKVFALF